MKTNLTVVIPILEMGDKEKDLFANAIKSIEEQEQKVEKIVLVVPKDSEVKKSLKEFDFSEDIKDLVEIVENPGKTDYCSQINLGVEEVQTEWFRNR